MTSVLLVDDESYVIDDLEILFPWSYYGIDHIFKAYSGIEALKILEENKIDVLISDIAMPVLTGLELVGNIQKNKEEVYCILLTGYSEFKYAKEAIQYGVKEYLLKPLDTKKLSESLEKYNHSMKEQREKNHEYSRVLHSYREWLPSLKENFLKELLENENCNTKIRLEKMKEYGLSFHLGDEISILLIRLEERLGLQMDEELLLFEYAILNIVDEIFGNCFEVWKTKNNHGHLIILLKHKNNTLASDEILFELCTELYSSVAKYLKFGISVVISDPVIFSMDIREKYEQLLTVMRKQIVKREGGLHFLKDNTSTLSVGTLDILFEPPTFNQLLELGQWDKFRNKLQQLENEYNQLVGQTEEYLDVIRNVLLIAFNHFAHKNKKLLSELVESSLIYKTVFRSIESLIHWANQVLDVLSDKLENKPFTQHDILINDIELFINIQLSTVSLQAIADHVQLHPVSVSKLFKQIKGIGISEYIFIARMELARYLLLHTTDKIYTICSKVGYSNSQYFIKVFRDRFDITPHEFRNKNRGAMLN